MRRFAVPGAVVLACASATAQVTCFTNHATWQAIAGAPSAAESFSGFVVDTSFEPFVGGSPVALSVGTLVVSSGGTGFRNRIEVAPFQFGDNNGTTHASCFTNQDEPTEITLTFPSPVSAAGFFLSQPIGGENVEVSIEANSQSLAVCLPAANTNFEFVGFTSAVPVDAIRFRSVNLVPGGGGEGFGLDDIEIVSGTCAGNPTSYCTAGTSTNGCVPAMSASGLPSAAAASGFTLTCTGLEGQKSGIVFYGISGGQAQPWATGSSSLLCVKAPTQRTVTQSSGGTIGACDGQIGIDFLAFMAANPGALGQPLAAGQAFNAQTWYRDPPAVKTTNLSDGMSFTMCP
jgi:hypothetical protein